MSDTQAEDTCVYIPFSVTYSPEARSVKLNIKRFDLTEAHLKPK